MKAMWHDLHVWLARATAWLSLRLAEALDR